jgi:hypothetical protein
MTKSVNVVELHSVVTDLLNPSPPVGAEGLEPAAFALTGRDPLAPRESTTCDDTRPHGLAAFSRGAQSGSAMLRLSRRRYLNMLLSDKEEPGANEPRPLRMSRPLLLGGVWVAAAVVVIALFLGRLGSAGRSVPRGLHRSVERPTQCPPSGGGDTGWLPEGRDPWHRGTPGMETRCAGGTVGNRLPYAVGSTSLEREGSAHRVIVTRVDGRAGSSVSPLPHQHLGRMTNIEQRQATMSGHLRCSEAPLGSRYAIASPARLQSSGCP